MFAGVYLDLLIKPDTCETGEVPVKNHIGTMWLIFLLFIGAPVEKAAIRKTICTCDTEIVFRDEQKRKSASSKKDIQSAKNCFHGYF